MLAPAPAGASSPSLFELPVSRKARMLKLFAVLALDLVLAGAGVAMIVSYLGARDRAGTGSEVGSDAGVDTAAVEIGDPVVGDPDPHAPTTAADTPAAPAPRPSAPRREARSERPSSGSAARAPAAGSRPTSAPPEVADDEPTGADPAPSADEGVLDTDSEPVAAPDTDKDARMQLLAHRVGLVVNKNQAQFQRCYRQVAKAGGPVQGRVVIRFKVGQDGRASSVRATENETRSERLAACLVAQFGSWSFPGHTEPEPIDFMWPIVFKAPG